MELGVLLLSIRVEVGHDERADWGASGIDTQQIEQRQCANIGGRWHDREWVSGIVKNSNLSARKADHAYSELTSCGPCGLQIQYESAIRIIARLNVVGLRAAHAQRAAGDRSLEIQGGVIDDPRVGAVDARVLRKLAESGFQGKE